MAKYDGPSYFKKEHPKIKPIVAESSRSKKAEKPKYTLPNTIRTRDSLEKEASQYIKTPSRSLANDPPPERYPFKRTHTPASLQKLDGWANQKTVNPLYEEITARLETNWSYLLFADHLSDEMMKQLQEKSSVPIDKQTVVEEKAALVQEELTKNLMKPSTGLHRSLTNIMDDEQKTINKNKNSLNKLFNQPDSKKKTKKFKK